MKYESPVVKRYATAAGHGHLTLRDASATVKWLVRAAPQGAVAELLGVPFGSSAAPAGSGGALVLGSRPGEWIVLGDSDGVSQVIGGVIELREPDRSDTPLVTALDWTHGRALYRLTGADSARVLEKVCSLDWSDEMTPDGAVASASVARVTCDIARADVDGAASYLIFCDRSFGQYLFDALLDSGSEFGVVVSEPSLALS